MGSVVGHDNSGYAFSGRVPSGVWWSWNDVQMPLGTCMGTWSNLLLLGVFFQDGLERSPHLSLPKVWEGPHGVAASPQVDCCFQCMSGTTWCSQSHLLACPASRHMSWPGPLPCWSLCGFHGGQPWYCLWRMVEWPLIHPWLGCLHWLRVHHGSSSRILLLWGHGPVNQASHSGWVCTIERMGSHCVSSPILVRCLGVKAYIDMVPTQRSNWISVLVLDGRWLRASARSISLPGLHMMTRSYCCRQRSILWRCAGATMRFCRLIIWRGLWSVCMMNVLPYRYVWNFHSHIW